MELKESIKKYLLVKYTKSKMEECENHISKTIPWIRRKGLSNNIETHCRVLLNSILSGNEKQSLRQNKFMVDSILKYTLGRSESLLKSNRNAKDIKAFMQLNSFIVYDEIIKGFSEKKSKKAINFNIEKQLSEVQDKINLKENIEDILNEKIGA